MLIASLTFQARGEKLTPADGFGGIFEVAADGRVVVANDDEAPRLFSGAPLSYAADDCVSFECRIANRHCREGKRYRYRDSEGHSHRVASTEWGIAWDETPDGRHSSLVVYCFDTMEGDSFSRRLMHYRLAVADSVVAEGDIEKGVHTEGGFNTIVLKLDDGTATVGIGDAEPIKVASCRRVPQAGAVALLVGKAAEIEVREISMSVEKPAAAELSTELTQEQLCARLAASRDLYEGYWEYLDRSLRETRMRLGGRYRLALLADGAGGYDIIYVDGAQVEGSRWHFGMLKGRLRPIGFIGQYDLIWYDATMHAIDHDANARFVSSDILELAFPLESGIVRFKRVR